MKRGGLRVKGPVAMAANVAMLLGIQRDPYKTPPRVREIRFRDLA